MEDVVGHAVGTAGPQAKSCPTIIIFFNTVFVAFCAFILGNACFISSTICLVKGEILGLSYVLAMAGDMILLVWLSLHFASKWKRNLERQKRNLENQNKETKIPDHEGVYVELE